MPPTYRGVLLGFVVKRMDYCYIHSWKDLKGNRMKLSEDKDQLSKVA